MPQAAIEMIRLLIMSRDAAVIGAVESAAEANWWKIETAADAWDAIDKLYSETAPDLLVLDMPDRDMLGRPGDGLQVLRVLCRIHPALRLVLIGHAGDLDRKREAIRMGARDYLLRPLEQRQLEAAILRHIPARDEAAKMDIAAGNVNDAGDQQLDFEQDSLDSRIEQRAPTLGRLRKGSGRGAGLHPLSGGILGYKSLRLLLQSVKEEAEKHAIALALENTGWNRKAAARLLKTSYRSVLYKIEQYQMSSPNFSKPSSTNGFDSGNAAVDCNSHEAAPVADMSGRAYSRYSER